MQISEIIIQESKHFLHVLRIFFIYSYLIQTLRNNAINHYNK